MGSRGRWAEGFLAVLCLMVMVSFAEAAEPRLVVLPIDRATFWAGQKFDFEVELQGAKADKISVSLNGKDAASLFGKKEELSDEEALTRLRFSDVTFAQVGPVEVQVVAVAGG